MANSGIVYKVRMTDGIKRWATAWRNSLDFLGCSECMTDLAKGYRYYISKFVPKASGDLRKTATTAIGSTHGLAGAGGGGRGNAFVRWIPTGPAKAYFHYQWVGDVYGPNKPVWGQGPNQNGAAGVHVGWQSVGGMKKTNTGKKMGTPFTYTLHDGRVVKVKGYTTPNTRYNWIDAFEKDTGDEGAAAVRIKAGRYMYDAFFIRAKQMGLDTKGERHHGSYAAYNSWRQIVNREIT